MIKIDPAWEKYIERINSPLPELLDQLERETVWKTVYPQMLSGKIQAGILHFLAGYAGARHILEVGTFTGYATLALAAALPPGGSIITLEQDDENLRIARRFFRRSPWNRQIRVVRGDALQSLRKLQGPFDLIFLDADKEHYPDYFPLLRDLLAPRGLWITDNVLWNGKVLNPTDAQSRGIAGFNRMVAGDPDLQRVILPLRDGLMLIRKK